MSSSNKFTDAGLSDKLDTHNQSADSDYFSGSLQDSEKFSSEDLGQPDRIEPIACSGVQDIDSGVLDEQEEDKDKDIMRGFNKLNLKEETRIETTGLNDLNKNTQQTSIVFDNSDKKEVWEKYYTQDDCGDTYLHIAIFSECSDDKIKHIIEAAPVAQLLDTFNDDAQTALHLGVSMGRCKIVRMLIAAGAKPSPRNLAGDSPLHIAAKLGDLDSCRAILYPVAQTEREALDLSYNVNTYYKCNLDQWNYEGQTAVHCAALNGRVNVLRELVRHGADINAREGKSGYTALHMAVATNNESVVNFLLSECSNLDVHAVTYGGRTALQLSPHVAEAFLNMLLTKGVSPYCSDIDEDDDSDEEIEYTQGMVKMVTTSA